MKYVVHMAVEGRIDLEVEAKNPDAAHDKALFAFGSVDLGDLETVDVRPMCCEDGTGAIVKEY